jgi:hypothetical protein
MNTLTIISLPRHTSIMNLLASLETISFFITTLYGVTVHVSCTLCVYLWFYKKWLNVSKLWSYYSGHSQFETSCEHTHDSQWLWISNYINQQKIKTRRKFYSPNLQHTILVQNDDAQPHYTTWHVCFFSRRIGRVGSLDWPFRSPDRTHIFISGQGKNAWKVFCSSKIWTLVRLWYVAFWGCKPHKEQS